MRLKRLISAFIACAMLVTFMPMQAFAVNDAVEEQIETVQLNEELVESDGLDSAAPDTLKTHTEDKGDESIALGESKGLSGTYDGVIYHEWDSSDPQSVSVRAKGLVGFKAEITAKRMSANPVTITHKYRATIWSDWNSESWEVTVTPPAAKFFVLKAAGNEPESGADQGQDNYYPNADDTIEVDGITYDETTGLPGFLTEKGYELLQDNDGEYFALGGEAPIDGKLVEQPIQKFMDALYEKAELKKDQDIVWYVMKDQKDGYHVDGYVSNIPVDVTYVANYPDSIEEVTYTNDTVTGSDYSILSLVDCGFQIPEGYEFTGWKLENSDTDPDKTYQSGSKFALRQAETFVAQWEEDEEPVGSTDAYFYVLKPEFEGDPSEATYGDFYYVGQGNIENPSTGEAEGQLYTVPEPTADGLPNEIAAKLEDVVWYNVSQADGANGNPGYEDPVDSGEMTWHVDGYLTAPLTVNAVNSENEQEFSGLANWPKSESVRVGTEYTVVVGTEGEADIHVLEKITVNGQHYAYDKPAQTDLLKDTMELEGVSVDIPYALDNNEDGIPDKYQATATYKVEHGAWNDGTTEDKTEVVTLLNDAGNWSESGKGTLQHKPEVGNCPAEGYEEGSWNKNDTEITADTEFIYSYRETGEIDPPVTPEWDTSKSKTAKNLDANYESQVTLSLPSAQETLESDVVFVLDKSSCEEEVTTEALAMLEDLYASVQNSGATINVGAVQFAGRAVVSCELTPLSEEAISEGGAIYSGLKETKIKSGTNLQAGLLEAQKLLAADTAVADNRKYVVVITDGLTRQFLEGDTLMTVYNALEADGNRVWGSPSGWCIANGFVDGVYQIPGEDWDTYFAAVKQNVARDGNLYAHDYDVYGSTPEGENIPSPYVPAEGNSLRYALCLDRAIYEAEKVYRELEADGYRCYTVFAGKSDNQLGDAFVKHLNNGNHLDFADIQNDIYYLLDAGSYVVDVIGSGNDNYGNAYNFDFVNDIDKLKLTVNGIALDKEKIDEYTYGFGKLEVNSNSAREANYKFILRYYPAGIEGNSECFIWYINVPVSNFAPVQLNYTVKLTNPQDKPGTYGQYDADGSKNYQGLYTNNSATLYPVDSNGIAGAAETFAKPTVSYTVPENTVTVTFKPGTHGNLRGAAGENISYEIKKDSQLEDNPVPRVDEDDDWDFTEWLCTEGSDNMKGQAYTAAEIADLVFTVDTDFVAQYEEESGGGGAHHPDAGDGDDDDNDRDDDTEEIIDEEVPLAETPWLNTEDHYAYIIGYSEDGTVRPNANITRAEVATIFFRLLTDEARDQFWMTSNNFSDVLPNDWYNNAVSTMVNMGIIQGYEDGTFRPNANITRAEFAAIAARFMASGYGVEDDLFTDIANHWARESINDAAMAGWINGYEDGTFRPDAAITRAEAVTLVNNVLQRKPDADHMLDSMIKWPDNPEGTWYYEAIQEATNSHDYDLFEDAEYETWTALQENRDWAALEKDWANAHSA